MNTILTGRRWPIALALALLGLLLVTCTVVPSDDGATPSATSSNVAEGSSPSPSSTPTIVAMDTSGEGEIPVGFTAEGYPFRGDPNAPVILEEFSDYQCPFCLRHFEETAPLLDEAYVKTGKVKHVFRDFPLTSIHPQAQKAAEAARCAGQQGAAAYWEMHDRLYAGQDEWAGNADAANVFKGYAAAFNLDTEAFNTCLDSGETTSAVMADVQDGIARGVSATPSFLISPYGFIAGAYPYATFEEAIEAALSGNPPTPTPTLTVAQANPLAPDPEKPGYTYSGHAFRGAPDAPITIIEVSDFQCPFCQTHALNQGARIDEEYVAMGKVRVIYFHLLGHIHSQKSAEAAECAGNQGKFWEMHDLLFAQADAWWSAENPVPLFKSYAESIGLDSAAFDTCMDTGATVAKVQNDHIIVVNAGVSGTPTFIVNQRAIIGSPDYATWKEFLDGMLESVGE